MFVCTWNVSLAIFAKHIPYLVAPDQLILLLLTMKTQYQLWIKQCVSCVLIDLCHSVIPFH